MPSFIIFHPLHAIAVNSPNRSVKGYGEKMRMPLRSFSTSFFFPARPTPSPSRHRQSPLPPNPRLCRRSERAARLPPSRGHPRASLPRAGPGAPARWDGASVGGSSSPSPPPMAPPEPSSTRCSALAPPPGPSSRSPLPLRLTAAGLACTPLRPLRLAAERRGARQGGRGEGAGEGKDGAAPRVAGVGNRGGAALHGRPRTSPKQGPPAHRRRRPASAPATARRPELGAVELDAAEPRSSGARGGGRREQAPRREDAPALPAAGPPRRSDPLERRLRGGGGGSRGAR